MTREIDPFVALMDAQKIRRVVSILRHHQMADPGAVGVKSSCGIAAVCRLVLNILEESA
tara:strand:- start:162 stop:338 length:177 start_codon:yes stop_codon:yes gene_type:complete